MTENNPARHGRRRSLKRGGGASSLPLLPSLPRRTEDATPVHLAASVLLPPIGRSGVSSVRFGLPESMTPMPARLPQVSPHSSRGIRRSLFSTFHSKMLREQLPSDVPAAGVIRDVAFLSKPGAVEYTTKAQNQDTLLVVRNLSEKSDLAFFGVFDGHGSNGHDISGFLRDHLESYLCQSLALVQSESPEAYSGALMSALKAACINLRKAPVDYTYSGSTAVTVLLKGSICLCANVGDSRAILVRRTLTEWKAVPLSTDHKPTIPEESSRVLAAGGKIAAYYNNAGATGGPLRVWLKNQRIPGLAMTRSIGDCIATRIGITSEPELQQVILTGKDKVLVLASDGIWEKLSNEEVVNIAQRCYEGNTAQKCAESLFREAKDRWARSSENCDDITVIVVFFA